MTGLDRDFIILKMYAFLTVMLIVIFTILVLHSRAVVSNEQRLVEEAEIVRLLHLTDMCVTTESRHTRHIALPEPAAAFQDIPGFLDHFPTSTFFWPPSQVKMMQSSQTVVTKTKIPINGNKK